MRIVLALILAPVVAWASPPVAPSKPTPAKPEAKKSEAKKPEPVKPDRSDKPDLKAERRVAAPVKTTLALDKRPAKHVTLPDWAP